MSSARAAAVKLLTKEDLVPEKADPYIFRFAPYISVAAAFIVFAVIPFAPDWGVITDINIGLLFILSVSSVGGAPAARRMALLRCVTVAAASP